MGIQVCERCKQPFSSSYLINKHYRRKIPCKRVGVSIGEAIDEHQRVNKVLVRKTKDAEHIEEKALKEHEAANEKFEKQLANMDHGTPEYKAAKEHIRLTGILAGAIDDTKDRERKAIIKELEAQNKDLYEFVDVEEVKYSSIINLKLDKKTGNSTVLLGSSKAGKSTALMYLYSKYYEEDISVLFTESPQIKLYKRKNLLVAPQFFPELIRDAHRINKATKNEYKFTFMMDDIVNQKENGIVKKLILILRNSKISSLVSLQSPTLLNKQSRGSINNILLFRFNTTEAIEQVVRMFLMNHLSGNMDEKIRLYQKITSDFGFIYFNPREDSVSYHRLVL